MAKEGESVDQDKCPRTSRLRGFFSRLYNNLLNTRVVRFFSKMYAKYSLRMSIVCAVISVVILLAVGPLLVPVISNFKPCNSSWFSFWTGWLPGVCSVGLSVSSIILTVTIAREQTNQNKFLNDMQTRLTLAANLPALRVCAVRFYSKEECAKQCDGIDRLEMGNMPYRFDIFFPADSIPANYRVQVEQFCWTFPEWRRKEGTPAPSGCLETKGFNTSILRDSDFSQLRLDFSCGERERQMFRRFYMFPNNLVVEEGRVDLVLRLKMEDLLLNVVMKQAHLGNEGGNSWDGNRLDLHLCLQCKNKYLSSGPPHSPDIFVADHSISAPGIEK